MKTAENKPQLWVNVRDLTEKQHVILRLEIIQRKILEDPHQFALADQDPKLKHVQKEIQSLQNALFEVLKDKTKKQFLLLEKGFDLLIDWQAETALEDTVLADNVLKKEIEETLIKPDLNYLEWHETLETIKQFREKMLDKYLGYFQSAWEQIDTQKSQTQEHLQKTLPEMAKHREKAEEISEMRSQIFEMSEQATRALSSGVITFVVIVIFCIWQWGGWGILYGLLAGYLVFSNIAQKFTYIETPELLELFPTLVKKYELKNIKPFYRFDNEEDPEQPTSFDASRGTVLMKLLTKDINTYWNQFNQEENRRKEYTQHLEYLDTRRYWLKAQIQKIEERQGLKEEGLFIEEAFEEAAEQPVQKTLKKPKVKKRKAKGPPVSGLADQLGLTENTTSESTDDSDAFADIPIEPAYDEPFVLEEPVIEKPKNKITVVRKIAASKPKPEPEPEPNKEPEPPLVEVVEPPPEESTSRNHFSAFFSRRKKKKEDEKTNS